MTRVGSVWKPLIAIGCVNIVVSNTTGIVSMHWVESDSEREVNKIEGILLNTWMWVDWSTHYEMQICHYNCENLMEMIYSRL